MRVLIVSEEPERRRWARSALGPDWEPLDAADGLEARDLAEDSPVDLVVADETAGPFGAFGLARELKMGAHPPAVIVLLERAQDTWLARWSGADRWLVRPVSPFALARAAAELAAERAPTDVGGRA